MPTSYTAPLYEGAEISFETFVLRCSRAMGATILLRDDPLDVLPTEENVIEASTYHAEKLASAAARLVELGDMTTEQAAQEAEREFAEEEKAYQIAYGDHYGLKRRYEHMRERVDAWEPPTEDHVGLKEFMLQQLIESISFDCHEPTKPTFALTPAGWLRREIESAERDVRYHREEAAKQAERNAERRLWVEALRENLEGVTA